MNIDINFITNFDFNALDSLNDDILAFILHGEFISGFAEDTINDAFIT